MVIGSKEVEDRKERSTPNPRMQKRPETSIRLANCSGWVFHILLPGPQEIGNHQSTRNHMQGVKPCEGKVDGQVGVGPRPQVVRLSISSLEILRSSMMMVTTSFVSMCFSFLDGGGTSTRCSFCRIRHRMAHTMNSSVSSTKWPSTRIPSLRITS